MNNKPAQPVKTESRFLGLGDDGRLHVWLFGGSEEMRRQCDDVRSTNVETFARDLHAKTPMCERCK